MQKNNIVHLTANIISNQFVKLIPGCQTGKDKNSENKDKENQTGRLPS